MAQSKMEARVFGDWAEGSRSILEPALMLYRDVDFAYALASMMVATVLALIAIAVVSHILRAIAIEGRYRAIAAFITFGVTSASHQQPDTRESTFAARFSDIDARLKSGHFPSGSLVDAWNRYRRTLSFIGAPPVRSTQRPNAYFRSAMPPPTWLGFCAGLCVAFGLLATFLGLVAALTFASAGMSSDNMDAMQAALRDLLSASASKFVTSVAGVGLSILLRLTERLLTVDLRSRLDRLSSSIEAGVRVDNDAHFSALSENLSRLLLQLSTDSTSSQATREVSSARPSTNE